MRTNLKTWSSRTDKIKKKKKKSHCNRVLVYTTNQQIKKKLKCHKILTPTQKESTRMNKIIIVTIKQTFAWPVAN